MACPTCEHDDSLRECPDCHRSPRIVWVDRLQRWVKLGGGATIAMTLAACYGPPQTDARPDWAGNDPTTTRAQDKAPEKLGDFAIGSNAQHVLTTLGEPTKRTEKQWEWSGVVVTTDGQTIQRIEVTAPSTLATSRGIEIGSKRADVEKAYGKDTGALELTYENDLVTKIVLR